VVLPRRKKLLRPATQRGGFPPAGGCLLKKWCRGVTHPTSRTQICWARGVKKFFCCLGKGGVSFFCSARRSKTSPGEKIFSCEVSTKNLWNKVFPPPPPKGFKNIFVERPSTIVVGPVLTFFLRRRFVPLFCEGSNMRKFFWGEFLRAPRLERVPPPNFWERDFGLGFLGISKGPAIRVRPRFRRV